MFLLMLLTNIFEQIFSTYQLILEYDRQFLVSDYKLTS